MNKIIVVDSDNLGYVDYSTYDEVYLLLYSSEDVDPNSINSKVIPISSDRYYSSIYKRINEFIESKWSQNNYFVYIIKVGACYLLS